MQEVVVRVIWGRQEGCSVRLRSSLQIFFDVIQKCFHVGLNEHFFRIRETAPLVEELAESEQVSGKVCDRSFGFHRSRLTKTS